jgi:hypothetical protein
MRFLLITAAIIVGSMVALQQSLQNGSLIHYLDTHPNEHAPRIHYYIGGSYYLLGDLQNSATHYLRISERYPKSSYAEHAYFNYLNDLDAMNTGRMQMADLYQTYIDRYPEGIYKDIVQKRIEFCRNAR